MDVGLVMDLYRHYGGVARSVLEKPKAHPKKGLDELLMELREAVDACNTNQVGGAIGRA